MAATTLGGSRLVAQAAIVRDSAGVTIVTSTPPVSAGLVLAARPDVSACVDSARQDQSQHGRAIGIRTADHGLLVSTADRRWMAFDSTGRERPLAGVPTRVPDLHPAWLAPYRGDTIAAYATGGPSVWLMDASGRSLAAFELDRWLVGTTSPALDAAGVLSDGSFVQAQRARPPTEEADVIVRHAVTLERFSFNGTSLGVFGTLTSGETFAHMLESSPAATILLPTVQPAFAHVLVVRAAGSRVFVGDGTRFEIAVFTPDGRLTMLVRSRRDVRPATPTDSAEWVREHSNAMAVELRLHMDSLPAFSRFEVDPDGHLWVEDSRVASGARSWSEFAVDGREVHALSVPTRIKVLAFLGESVLVSEVDAAGGEYVRVYRLVAE